ncbi:hypothetical protein [Pseudaminobacter soli (ex Li et al. 2025)]|uniref:DUF680 domain-containing protein n=1 Tax=Pseudaminobacter soli (ex Li et al. 2025) TaxID=1295366 RepID=A0A2P7SBN0_9HYPH|nr:hypothetical protein [Mesorhizobium soli]PSJ59870.1 hypothetical protein C7I85_16175 [Mesorhizobium soli]
MNKIILTLAAVVLASGTAFANDRFGDAAPALNDINRGVIATTLPQTLVRSGDAATASVVVKAPSFDHSSAVGFGATSNRIGASPRILYGSN